MKKALPLLLSLVLCLTLCACGTENTSPVTENSVQSEVPTESITESTTEPEPEISYEVTQTNINSWEVSSDFYWAAVNVEIINNGSTNLRLLNSFFDLENSDKKLVMAQKNLFAFPDIIAPGEKGLFSAIIDSEVPIDTTSTVIPRILVESTKDTPIRYNVTDVDVVWADKEYGDIDIIGRVENSTSITEDKVGIVTFVYGKDGALLGGYQFATLENLAPGEKAGFQTLGVEPPIDNLDEITEIICIAYPYREQSQN